MIDAMLAWLFALQIGGLPIFASDRADIYIQATNEVPYTVQYQPGMGPTDFFQFIPYPCAAFVGPGCNLYVFTRPDEDYPQYPLGGFELYRPTGEPIEGFYYDTGLGNSAFFSPFGLTTVYPTPIDPATALFQVEWIEASLHRHALHGVAGFTVCLFTDVVVSCAWGAVVAFTRLNF